MALLRNVPMVLVGLLMALGAQRAAAVSYEVVDLPDTVVGVDRMKFVYRMDESFAAFDGFNLLFDPARYAELSVILPLGADWDQVITQPDESGSLDGIVSSLALASTTGTTGTFEVGFTRLGATTPGSQPVEFFDDSFNVTSSTYTTAFVSGVPEPSTYALLIAGLLVLGRLVKRSSPESLHLTSS